MTMLEKRRKCGTSPLKACKKIKNEKGNKVVEKDVLCLSGKGWS